MENLAQFLRDLERKAFNSKPEEGLMEGAITILLFIALLEAWEQLPLMGGGQLSLDGFVVARRRPGAV